MLLLAKEDDAKLVQQDDLKRKKNSDLGMKIRL
jgi:predicted DNA-binding protein (UPF0278 family)